jgi:hypothetical protein
MPESPTEIKRKIAEAKRLGAIVVNRQQVTSGQLDTAILLWFLEMDPISTCTLASAALTVLHRVGSKTGKSSHIYNKEMEKLLGKKLKMAPNFFKHASRDPHEALIFAVGVNEFLLFDASNLYGKVYGSLTPLMRTFQAQFVVSHERAGRVRREEAQVFLPADIVVEQISALSRGEFLEKILPLFIKADV